MESGEFNKTSKNNMSIGFEKGIRFSTENGYFSIISHVHTHVSNLAFENGSLPSRLYLDSMMTNSDIANFCACNRIGAIMLSEHDQLSRFDELQAEFDKVGAATIIIPAVELSIPSNKFFTPLGHLLVIGEYSQQELDEMINLAGQVRLADGQTAFNRILDIVRNKNGYAVAAHPFSNGHKWKLGWEGIDGLEIFTAYSWVSPIKDQQSLESSLNSLRNQSLTERPLLFTGADAHSKQGLKDALMVCHRNDTGFRNWRDVMDALSKEEITHFISDRTFLKRILIATAGYVLGTALGYSYRLMGRRDMAYPHRKPDSLPILNNREMPVLFQEISDPEAPLPLSA